MKQKQNKEKSQSKQNKNHETKTKTVYTTDVHVYAKYTSVADIYIYQ